MTTLRLNPAEVAQLRALYMRACHGAGAEERWLARDRIDEMAAAVGGCYADLLRSASLDLMTYFATRPTSR